jgi:hypothetical protein
MHDGSYIGNYKTKAKQSKVKAKAKATQSEGDDDDDDDGCDALRQSIHCDGFDAKQRKALLAQPKRLKDSHASK